MGRKSVKLRRRWAAAAVSGAIAVTTAIVVTGGGAHAAGGTVDPAISGDPNAQGTISIFDSTGARISTGSLDDLVGDYFVASSATTKVGTTKAFLSAATPNHTIADSSLWFSAGLTGASAWPVTSPAGVVAAAAGGKPVNHPIVAGDGSLAGYFAAAVNDPTAGFNNIVQLRLEDSGPGKSGDLPFWQADVYIDSAAGTWTQLYPVPPASAITTAISTPVASPVSPAAHGSSVTITGTVSATDASHPAGTVELFDNTTAVGAATLTAATGAISATAMPADGSHSYHFVFTPASPATYNSSTSASLAYTVTAAPSATATTTTLTANPSMVTVGATVALTAAISPNTATGSVQFFDGATPIGAAVAVASGSAGTSTSTLTQGDHSLKATFTPTDSAAFQTSSGTLAYHVNPVPATTTTTTLALTPSAPVTQGTAVHFDATVTPNASGSINFYNGSTLLGTSAVASGAATFSTMALPAGALSLKAVFVPTDATAFGTSESDVVPYSVKAAPVSPTVNVTSMPASPVLTGASVSLVAHLDSTTATGTIQFLDDGSAIGAPVTVTGGTATTATSFTTTGDHSITASYLSDDHATFLDSLSAATVIKVNPPAQPTTTALAVTPASPVAFGTSVELQAMVTPAGANGSVQFTDGGKALGQAVAVSGGTASLATTLPAGSHSLGARFTATSAAAFGDSTTTSPTPLTVQAQGTSIVLTTDPAGIVSSGSSVMVTATLAPANAGGSVEFFDGQTSLGASSPSAGQAKITTAALTEGAHSLTAVFTPAYPLVLTSSTSDAVTLTVKAAATMAPPTSDGQALTPNQTLKAGDKVTLSAAGFVPGETVAVVVHSAPQTLSSVQADSSGNVSATVTIPSGLAAGTHTLSLIGQADTTSYTFVIAAAAPTTSAATSTAAGAASADPTETAAASSGGSLASTGAKVIPAALAALALIGGGFLLMGGARRRRSH
jgi:hypothetical protein